MNPLLKIINSSTYVISGFLLCRLLVVPSIEWLPLFMYVCIYFSMFTLLVTSLYIFSSNLACPFAPSNDHLRIRFLIDKL